jgi:hypothetical protein
MTDQQPIPVFRISLKNATGLSVLYLVLAVVVEFVRRIWGPRWADQVSLALESVPARTLELLGVFEPLRQAWLERRVSDLTVRVVYGVTAVVLIFCLGLAVGCSMWVLARLSRRRS